MDNLFKDAHLHIFSLLTIEELGQVSLVCKQWKSYSEDDFIWKPICSSFELKTIPSDCKSWRDVYKKFGSYYKGFFMFIATDSCHIKGLRILRWRWNPLDKDKSIIVQDEGLVATRMSGGHNPSIRGNVFCKGQASFYFEVSVQKLGDWFCFGYSTADFGVNTGQHAGKGLGSCAYYSDGSTFSIFTYSKPDVKTKKISDGDTVGMYIDLRTHITKFFLNGILSAKISNPDWIPDEGVMPTLSIGARAIVTIVDKPICPKEDMEDIDMQL